MDKQHLKKISSNLDRLTSSIADCFAMLRQVMAQPVFMQKYGQPPPMRYPNVYQTLIHTQGHRPVTSTPTMHNTSNDCDSNLSFTQQLFSDDTF